mmetsp:Transcript_4122/g.5298  ORF Transcript_4122/g.5298 Transcript_4122/m.5298 type:complete len:218 (-) Transcript_4122:9-662(-)
MEKTTNNSVKLLTQPPEVSISLQMLEQQYEYPLAEAANNLNVSITALKQIYRRHGIKRWPYRQVNSITKAIAGLEEDLIKAEDEDNKQRIAERIAKYESKKRLVIVAASCSLTAALRNAIFRSNVEDLDENALVNLKQVLEKTQAQTSCTSSDMHNGNYSVPQNEHFADNAKRGDQSLASVASSAKRPRPLTQEELEAYNRPREPPKPLPGPFIQMF